MRRISRWGISLLRIAYSGVSKVNHRQHPLLQTGNMIWHGRCQKIRRENSVRFCLKSTCARVSF
jgi:hypothetical protein